MIEVMIDRACRCLASLEAGISIEKKKKKKNTRRGYQRVVPSCAYFLHPPL
jgi:hypothetical protein